MRPDVLRVHRARKLQCHEVVAPRSANAAVLRRSDGPADHVMITWRVYCVNRGDRSWKSRRPGVVHFSAYRVHRSLYLQM